MFLFLTYATAAGVERARSNLSSPSWDYNLTMSTSKKVATRIIITSTTGGKNEKVRSEATKE